MDFVVEQLRQNKEVFYKLLKDVDKTMSLWKQSPEKWCLLEIVCHLYDEERNDFRFRTNWTLEKPNKVPPPINPVQWVNDHNYMGQDYKQMIDDFMAERDCSIVWLKSLKDPNWEHAFVHPKLGTLSANYFLNNWLAHDYLHIKQILRLKFDYHKHLSGEHLDYAGVW